MSDHPGVFFLEEHEGESSSPPLRQQSPLPKAGGPSSSSSATSSPPPSIRTQRGAATSANSTLGGGGGGGGGGAAGGTSSSPSSTHSSPPTSVPNTPSLGRPISLGLTSAAVPIASPSPSPASLPISLGTGGIGGSSGGSGSSELSALIAGSGGSTLGAPVPFPLTAPVLSNHHKRTANAPSAPSPLARASIVPSSPSTSTSTTSADDGDRAANNEGAIASDSSSSDEQQVHRGSMRAKHHQDSRRRSSSGAERRMSLSTGTIIPSPSATSGSKRYLLGSPSFPSIQPGSQAYAAHPIGPSSPRSSSSALTPGHLLLRDKRRSGSISASSTSTSSGGGGGSGGAPFLRTQDLITASSTSTSPTAWLGGSAVAFGSPPSPKASPSQSPTSSDKARADWTPVLGGGNTGGAGTTTSSGGSRSRSGSIASHSSQEFRKRTRTSSIASSSGLRPLEPPQVFEEPDEAVTDDPSTLRRQSSTRSKRNSTDGRGDRSSIGLGIMPELGGSPASPARSRRYSEFAQLSPDSGKQPSPPISTSFKAARILVSPTNPLAPLPSAVNAPPPHATMGPPLSTPSSSSSIPLSSSAKASNPLVSHDNAIRMTRVPTAVRLATDLKSQPGSLSGSFLSSPADALSHPGTSPLPVSDKPAEGGSLSNIPETPVATPNGSPERTPPPELEVSVPELPRRPSYLAKSMPSSPEQTRRYPLRQRVFLPPPNAFNLGVSPSDTDSGSVAVESIDSFGTLSPTESESAPPARTVLAPGQFRKPVGIPAHRDRSASANLPGPAAIPVIKNRVSSVGMSTSVQQGTLAELFRPEGPRRSSDDASPGLMEGDASRHANMILQSRKAKLQRWRPGSSGQGGPEESAVTPAIEAPRTGYFLPVTPHFRPQENNTEDIQSDDNFSSLGPAQHQRHGSDAASPDVVLRPSIDGSLLRPGPVSEVSTPWALESGNTSSVNGIEWVDWLDEYKKYKAAKLKAEQQTNGAEQNEEVLLDDIDHAPGGRDSPAAPIPQPLPSTEPLRRPVTPPRPERIPLRHAATSPIDTKASTRERPRQSSYSSNHSQHGKKRRNLAAKMEGWWTAVKSNFAPHPAQTRKPSFGAAVVRRPSRGESGRMHVKPLTGGRRSRPTSVIAPMVPDEGPAAKGKAKAAEKVTPPRMLRMSSSHGEIRSSASIAQPSPRQAAQPLLADSSVASGSTSQLNPDAFLSPAGPALTTTPGEMGLQEGPNVLGSPVKSASSLEARRKQPALSLKLENKPFVPPAQRRMTSQMSNHTSDTGETSGSSGASRPIRSILPPRSGSQSFKPGPGLTPGPSRWDQTPSPLYSFGTPQDGVKDAMQTDSDFTMASVKRHVKHRLTAAKDTCDRELRQVISSITAYVEFQIQQGVAMPKMATDDQSGVSDSETAPVLKRAARSRTTSVSLAARPVDAAALRNAQTSGVDSPQRRLSSRPTNRPSDIKATSLGRGLPSVVDHSSASSRSTSRSRSPMPGARLLPGDDAGVRMPAPDLLSGLQEIIAVSTDVLETNVSAMITRPGDCKSMVHRVQQIGRLWDEKKDLPGRGWYVQVLLAVAALCRVVEWWEAEKGFWDFDEDSDEDEPLAFVMRPSREEEDFAIGGEQRQAGSLPEPPTARPVSVVTSKTPLESPALQARAPEAQDLHLQAEHAKSVNIVIELSLGGEIIEWVNPAWEEVVGSDISSAIGTPISAWLAPADVSVLSDASRRLEGDDTHTAQARFRLLHVADISDDDSDREPGPAFIEFEGIGMLMRDRDSGVPSHTMWVIKPMPPSEVAEGPQAEVDPLSLISPGVGAPGFTFDKAVHSQELLCRICERQVPAWFFEKHNETCNEVHRLEADIAATNEKVADMRKAVLELKKSLGADDQRETIKYQGMPLINEVASTANTVPQAGALLLAVRKIQHALLDEAIDVLAAALRISTPSMREGAVDQPIQYQMLLSPTSEDKLTLISRWVKPDTDDAAFALLFRNVDDIIREKQTTVNRMRNTIMYSERVRQEWESKVEKWMQQAEDGSGSSGESQSGEEAEATPAADETEAPEATRSNSDPQPTTSGDGAAEAAALTAELKPPAILARHQTSPAAVTLPTSTSHHRGGSGDQGGSSSDSPVTLSPSVSLRKGKHSRHGSLARLTMQGGAMSPRLPSVAPMSRTTSTSIKDFDIIKPISRGAFGSVYLAKKRTTGDYFAIKALKKSDMIAKNQITNVKAERTILMSQSSSPYVAKLFFSFQNRDYLYLVMEYLNGGDCAALVKTLGGLPEDWARNYIAEVILGLEYLHDRGVVHRDLKPDNLLIDAKGHLKLTDFGLSKIGLLNRQVGGPRPAVLRGTDLRRFNDDQSPNAPSLFSGASPIQTPDLLGPAASSYFGGHLTDAGSADESSGSELPRPKASVGGGGGSRSISSSAPRRSKEPARFVGTPDYLCPESILGFGADDETVDWWALGVVLYEFLYGFPPFHDETPEKVFDNIVSRRINWYEDEMELSPEARDLMERLMCTDPKARLGANGASEIKQHAFFAGLDWDNICDAEASFVPSVTDPESTDYFDARGATSAVFLDDEAEDDHSPRDSKASLTISPQDRALKTLRQQIREDSASPTGSGDDFGTFDYRNLPVLKQANDDTIKRFRSESFAPGSPGALLKDRRLDQVTRRRARNRGSLSEIPPSPSGSTSSSASTPSRGSALPLTPGLGPTLQPRRVSDQHAQLVKVAENMDAETLRRNSAPESLESPTSSSALRADAAETPDQGPVTGTPPRSIQAPQTLVPRKDEEGQQARGQSRPCDVLIAEDNPISQKILETLLTRMGCRCVCVADGAEALAASLSEIHFDLIFLDLVIPNISGEEVARMIRSTNNANVSTPIIAATSYEHKQFESTFLRGPTAIFSAILIKPIGKKDLVECLARLGFALGPPPGTNRSSQSNSALNLAQQATTILEPPPGPRTPGQVRAEGYLQIPVRPIEASEVA